MRHHGGVLRRPVLSAVTAVYLVMVGWVTLGPQPVDAGPHGWVRQAIAALDRLAGFGWVTYSGVEFTANVAMFVPMGILFTLRFGLRRWWAALLVGIGATCLIEGIQLFLPARFSDVRDLIANTLGALIGIGIVAGIDLARRPLKRMFMQTH